MILRNMQQPAYNTTLIGVLKAVSDYLGYEYSQFISGAIGHAFLINIHNEICPSGPYVWNYDKMIVLLEKIGIKMVDLGHFDPKSSNESRSNIQKKLVEKLDKEIPCSLVNLENQTMRMIPHRHTAT